MRIHPVILCGGSGTRLWPLSRTAYPKQFVTLEGGHTLFKDTLRRAVAASDAGKPVIVCNKDHRFYVSSSLQEDGLNGTIILEPKPRNTAPAIALAALAVLEESDGLLLILPSDHALDPADAFYERVREATPLAEEGRVVTFGIQPASPETAYGYIRGGSPLGLHALNVERFLEKPDEQNARAMLAQGGYFWNSGIFFVKASTYLDELRACAPAMFTACREAWAQKRRDLDFFIPGEAFLTSPANSIDYAVMEHTHNAVVMPLDITWSDLGSWNSFYAVSPKDAAANACKGDILAEDSSGCYLHSSHRLIAALGVKDLAVVETQDAVLVALRERAQDVKTIVSRLQAENRAECEMHLKVYRPWGSYETLVKDERFQVKRIIVTPGDETSLQLHYHRSEHWIIVSGTAEVTIGETVRIYTENESVYIPLGTKHRIKNPGTIPLVFIEVQSGPYLGEDDIVRLEDDYGRQDGAHKL